MKGLSSNDKIIAYSLKQLISNQKEKYEKETIIENKEIIANKLICDKKISEDLLNIINNMNIQDKKSNFNTFENYYHILQYSLSTKENLKFYNSLKELNPQIISKHPEYEFLAVNDPINNFKNICSKFSIFIDEINDLNKVKINLENIQKYIDDMLKVYDINLEGYYYPPREEYPIYVYNFYSFSLFQTLKKFRTKKHIQLFKTSKNKEKKDIKYTELEWIGINYKIGTFFKLVKILFEKFSYNNIKKDLKVLKIILHYFKCFEFTRDSRSNLDTFEKIIKCLNSEAITSDILKSFEYYKKNQNIPIQENEWDTIRFNENVYIKYPIEVRVKIKHFNKNILNMNDIDLLTALNSNSIEYLNIDGLTQNSIIKFSPEIEQYSKKLLKSIISSEKYINCFFKYYQRFNSNNKIKDLLKDIFNGPNSNFIFDEIWENIIFIPFSGEGFYSLNSREQYSIFINSNPKFNHNISFQNIIPIYHSQFNNLLHEFTNKISLVIAANLEYYNFEKLEIKEGIELKELLDLQNIYFKKYNQNNKIYNYFNDLGNLIEVEMYGIRPRKFKTFSGLFCLDCDSYAFGENAFREKCVELYNFNSSINIYEKSDEHSEKESNNKIKDILKKLLDSDIAKLLSEYFYIDENLKNESFVGDDKPREFNSLYNEEFTIDIDYCDKLD